MVEFLRCYFPISGVETYCFLPSLVMFLIATVVSPAGVSGAFILLPFQVSVLGYTSAGVSGTNFVYNIVSIPIGVFRHIKSRTLSWNLFLLLLGGTIPGIFFGYYLRVVYLLKPERFKIFVGCVLFYLGVRTLLSSLKSARQKKNLKGSHKIEKETISLLKGTVFYGNVVYKYSTLPIVFASLIVGVVGGSYGIGGGALMAPFLISVLGLPPAITSGATLFSTWCTSVLAALFYAFGPKFGTHTQTSPDWLLGILFGLGGMAGIFVGTRLQSKVPDRLIKFILGVAVMFISLNYLSFLFK